MDKDYWRLKKREQRARKGLVKPDVVAEANVQGIEMAQYEKPEGATEKEWEYALERAARAKRYAEKMPGFVRPGDLKYQDPVWQWENEVRGRYGGVIGGSLSGTRSQEA